MSDIPKPNRCAQCGEWWGDAHCCPANNPIVYDLERMKKALEGPSHELPPDLKTPEEIGAYITQLADRLQPPPTPADRQGFEPFEYTERN